jgi:hypothetical protein
MKDRIFIVLLSSWLAPLESLKVPSVQQPQERGTMLVDAKVFSLIQTNLHGRPDALASSTAARKSKNREDGGLATLKGYKTNLRGGIDVNLNRPWFVGASRS